MEKISLKNLANLLQEGDFEAALLFCMVFCLPNTAVETIPQRPNVFEQFLLLKSIIILCMAIWKRKSDFVCFMFTTRLEM